MEKWIFLMIGGIAGTLSRYGLAGAVTQKMGAAFPWGTIAVNIAGCFVVGFLDVILDRKFLLGTNVRLLLITGFCGAFTTFSALILETSSLLKAHGFLYAAGNVMVSFCAGFVAFKLGAFFATLV